MLKKGYPFEFQDSIRAIFFTFLHFISHLVSWATSCALSYYYMVSAWGGYVYIINLIPLHILVLLIMGRYSHKLYISYTTFYTIGQLAAMTIPFVGFQPIRTR